MHIDDPKFGKGVRKERMNAATCFHQVIPICRA